MGKSGDEIKGEMETPPIIKNIPMKRRRSHSVGSLHRRNSFGTYGSMYLQKKTGHHFAELFRFKLDSKVAAKLYGHHRNFDAEQERQEDIGRFIIHPMSDFRFCWDIIIISILFFQVLVLPVHIAFYSNDFSPKWLAINGVSDFFFIMDIVFNFFTGIPDLEDEHLTILNKKEIRERYMKGWFFIDLLSSIPFEYIFLILESGVQSNAIAKASRGFKILKLAKMLNLLKLFRLTRLLRYMRKFEDATSITSSHLRILKLISLMLLLAHWLGCLQYLIPYLEDFPPDCWVRKDHLLNGSVWEKYSWSVFKAMSHMLTIGYGRHPPSCISELWMSIFSMMIGGAFYATFIGGISSLSLAIDSVGRKYGEKLEQVNQYLKYKKLPRPLRTKVQDYYEHRFQRKCVDEEVILKEISPSLREEIRMYQLGDLVRSVPFFKDAEADFLEELAIHLHFEVYLKGETIMKIGKRGNKMYFIDRGIVEVVTEAGEVTATLDKGSHFGEIYILSKLAKRGATVRAKCKCELYSLSRDDFNSILQDYPHLSELMRIASEMFPTLSGPTDGVGNINPALWVKHGICVIPENANPCSAFRKNSFRFPRKSSTVHPTRPKSEDAKGRKDHTNIA